MPDPELHVHRSGDLCAGRFSGSNDCFPRTNSVTTSTMVKATTGSRRGSRLTARVRAKSTGATNTPKLRAHPWDGDDARQYDDRCSDDDRGQAKLRQHTDDRERAERTTDPSFCRH